MPVKLSFMFCRTAFLFLYSSRRFVVGVVCLQVIAGPYDLRGPGLRRLRPEGGRGRQSQRQPCCTAAIEASGGDVGFAETGLMAGKADGLVEFDR
jgi:hypothetical protein